MKLTIEHSDDVYYAQTPSGHLYYLPATHGPITEETDILEVANIVANRLELSVKQASYREGTIETELY